MKLTKTTPICRFIDRQDSIQLSSIIWAIFNQARCDVIGKMCYGNRDELGQLVDKFIPCSNLFQVIVDFEQHSHTMEGIVNAFSESLYVELMEWSNGNAVNDKDIKDLMNCLVPIERQNELKSIYLAVEA